MSERLPWEGIAERPPAPPMKRAGILVDPRRCVGCHACAVSCKTENDVALGGFRIRTHYLRHPERGVHVFVPMMCQHCQDAPCLPACPTGAVFKEEDGRVRIDDETCDGNQDCIKACPYDAIHIDPRTGIADKCDLCHHRTEVGLDPACIEVCPTEAIVFGDLGDLDSDVARRADKTDAQPLRPEHETRPTIQYVGLTPWMAKDAKGVQLQDGENDIVYEAYTRDIGEED